MNQKYYELWEMAGFREDENGNAVIIYKSQSKKGEKNGNSQSKQKLCNEQSSTDKPRDI